MIQIQFLNFKESRVFETFSTGAMKSSLFCPQTLKDEGVFYFSIISTQKSEGKTMVSSSLKEGSAAPDFCLSDQNSEKTCLKDFKSKWVVLYFYPKDNTAGCKQEAVDFTAAKGEFLKNGAVILGVSKDTVASHQKFIEKAGLTLTLLADPDLTAIKLFDVWQLKKFMGKENMGTVRTTFLINPEGKIAEVWNNVRVKGHVDAVLEELKKRR